MLPFILASCGSLLGISEPTDRVELDNVDGGMNLVDGAVACLPTQKVCSGACVEKNDPTLGCGAGCTACPTPQNATAACGGSAPSCIVGACHAGFGDCNTNPSDGCEAQLSTTTSCGDCATNCLTLGKKYCTPQGMGKYACTDSCSAPNAICNTECVDPRVDAKNCGNCGNDCTLPNGTGTCVAGSCHVTCNALFCPPSCVSDDETCFGNACQPCPAGTKCGATGCVSNACAESNTACGVQCNVDCTAAPFGPNFVCGPAHSCVCPMTNAACGQMCTACPATMTCSPSGVCSTTVMLCQTGQILCASGCVDKSTSPNCGTCGNDCAPQGSECCLTGMSGLPAGLPLNPPVMTGDGLYACTTPGPATDGGSCRP